jgi:RimJ/RimL family protein N-acetyltransferase
MIELTRGPAVVREWRREDVAGLARQANDRRVWLNMRDAFPHPYDRLDAEAFITAAMASTPPNRLAIVADGQVAGGIGYTLHGDVERVGAEVGYWLGHEFWGRGLATAAVQALTDHAFRSHPELCRLWAVPYATNPASARVLEKAGYLCEGTLRQSAIKDGRVLDQRMYAITRDDWAAAQAAGGDRSTAG